MSEIKFEKHFEINILGKSIRARTVRVPIEKIKLDPTNVRLRHLPEEKTEKKIEEIIWKEPDTKQLCDDIEFTPGLREPPYIDSNFLVREGARRVVCCRKLIEKYRGKPKETKFNNILCVQFPDEMSEKEIALFLATIHVHDKQPWRKFNQALYINELHEKHGMSYEDIRIYLHMGKKTVLYTINAFKAHNRYGLLYSREDKKWLSRYSYFEEFFKRSDLEKYNKSEETLLKVMKWIKENKITQGLQIRQLSSILGNRDAIKILDSPGGKFEWAIDVAAKEDPLVDSKFYRTIDKAAKALMTMPREEILSTAQNELKLKMLRDLQKTLEDTILEIETIQKIKKKERDNK